MHTLLTDRLVCPRCGPPFGLILFAERAEDRRILEGGFGCPNCRDRYAVHGGFADLRAQPRSPFAESGGVPRVVDPGNEEVIRLAALLGLSEGPGHVFLAGSPVRLAPALASMLEGIEVVAADASLRAWEEEKGVSRIAVRGRIPVFPRSLRGVALGGEAAESLLAEAVRAVAPLGRVVVAEAPRGTASKLEEAGLSLVLEDQGFVVAVREGVGGAGPPPGTAPPGTGPLADGRLPVVP